MQKKLQRRAARDPGGDRGRRTARSRSGGATSLRSTSTSVPCYAIELPDEDADELEVRLPLTSFLRWVNLTGWAGLAIGNMQLVAPRDEVVLAAGLAWERG